MDYAQLLQTLSVLSTQASSQNGFVLPADFSIILPSAISYAEARIYKELTLLAARAQDASLTFSGTTRTLDLSLTTYLIIVPEGLSLITPLGSIPALGTRWPYQLASLDTIDVIWPTESLLQDPTSSSDRFWAMKDATTMVVCGTPNAAYVAEVTGLFQPAPISVTNTTTYLYSTYPTLYQSACMVYIMGYMRNFGAKSDNPQMALSWEAEYQVQKIYALDEELRRRGKGTGWSPNNPTPLATKPMKEAA